MNELNRTELLEIVTTASSVVAHKSAHESWRCVLLTLDDGTVTATGHNGEITVVSSFECDGVMPWRYLVPAAKLLPVLREMNSETVTLEPCDAGLRISSTLSEFTLATMDADLFPVVDKSGRGDGPVTVPSGLLRDAIRQTVFACDLASTRYALGGVLFEIEADTLRLVATDTRRLAVVELPADTSFAENISDVVNPVVPQIALQIVERSMTGDVIIVVGTNHVVFFDSDTTIVTRQVEGRFPQWQGVIPKSEHIIEVNAGALVAALRQATITTNEDSRGVDLQFMDGSLIVRGRAAEVGESNITVPVSGDLVMTSKMDPTLLLQWLKTVPPESLIQWGVSGPDDQHMMTLDNARYVQMPLSTEGA